MTNKEAKDYLLNVSYMIGTTAVEYMTQKDGDKIREAIESLEVPSAEPEPSEITDEQAILHLQSTGWMQNHDKEMYEMGLRKQLADDSEGYGSLIPCEDTISRQAAIDAVSYACFELRGVFEQCEDALKALPPATSSIPISWIEKYIDWLNGLESPFSTITALQVSLMVKRWKGDCPLPVNFFPDGKRKEDTK